VQKEEVPVLFQSVFECNRAELKATIRVTDDLLQELLTRQILIQQNVDDIKVSS